MSDSDSDSDSEEVTASDSDASTTLSFKSAIAEVTLTVDLKPILDNLDSYSENHYPSSHQSTLNDVVFEIECHPNVHNTEKNCTSVEFYVDVTEFDGNPSRKIHASIAYDDGSGYKEREDFVRSVSECSPYGWSSDIITLEEYKRNPVIQFHIKLIEDPLFVLKEDMQTFLEQNQRMHNLSKRHGDVTLVVKLPPKKDQNEANLCSPPKKKRKLNKQNNNNNNKRTKQTDRATKTNKDNNEIKVSSIVLRSASRVFDRMLHHNMREKQKKKIEVPAQTMDDVTNLIYFTHTNELRNKSNVMNIIVLAHYYEMDRLFWECANRLIKNVNVANFAKTINIFDKYEITEGYESLMEFAKNNKDEVQKADDFDTISHGVKCVISMVN